MWDVGLGENHNAIYWIIRDTTRILGHECVAVWLRTWFMQAILQYLILQYQILGAGLQYAAQAIV